MILDKIVAQKRLEVAESKARKPLDLLAEEIESAPPPRDFREALRPDGISLIAEIKRRSPSRGDILPGVDTADAKARADALRRAGYLKVALVGLEGAP